MKGPPSLQLYFASSYFVSLYFVSFQIYSAVFTFYFTRDALLLICFILPFATPPNAIVYPASGMKTSEMLVSQLLLYTECMYRVSHNHCAGRILRLLRRVRGSKFGYVFYCIFGMIRNLVLSQFLNISGAGPACLIIISRYCISRTFWNKIKGKK